MGPGGARGVGVVATMWRDGALARVQGDAATAAAFAGSWSEVTYRGRLPPGPGHVAQRRQGSRCPRPARCRGMPAGRPRRRPEGPGRRGTEWTMRALERWVSIEPGSRTSNGGSRPASSRCGKPTARRSAWWGAPMPWRRWCGSGPSTRRRSAAGGASPPRASGRCPPTSWTRATPACSTRTWTTRSRTGSTARSATPRSSPSSCATSSATRSSRRTRRHCQLWSTAMQ